MQSKGPSPVLLVPKKNRTGHFCMYYCRLKAVKIQDSYFVLRMETSIASLGGASILSTMHDNSGYWQVDIADKDQNKTAFPSDHGIFRFTCMPYGLKRHGWRFNKQGTSC